MRPGRVQAILLYNDA